MKYCSMSTMYYSQRGKSEKTSVEESLKRHANLGIKIIDLNMCAVGRFGQHQFDRDDWQDQAHAVKNLANSLGIEIVQTHLPYQGKLHNFDFYDKDSYQHMKECTLRAMKISNIVGAKWAVVHPVFDPRFSFDNINKQREENYRFYEDVLQESQNGCCGIAFENMINHSENPQVNRYCVTVEDLIDLVDSYKSPKVQITWDFGHANLHYGDNQDGAIRKIGSRLKAVHVADNFGKIDDHLAPYQGSINWDKIFKSLIDINFDGYWDFEIGKTYSNLPEELKDYAMVLYNKIAEQMIDRFEEIKKESYEN